MGAADVCELLCLAALLFVYVAGFSTFLPRVCVSVCVFVCV